ncbi:MAG: type IV pilus twitching motility protein PilT [Candidatus Shapirobacteria bacterium]
MHTKITELLSLAVANKASDIHLITGSVPKLRVFGELVEATQFANIEDKMMEEMIFSLLTEEQKKIVLEQRELDFSVESPESRFRCNVYYQKGLIACALRLISAEIPGFGELNLPESFKTFTTLKQGFVLVTGPTGHGKSTTIASILNEINKTKGGHIVTIEDPVEYLIKPIKAMVSQREIGSDTKNFDLALRSCLRQDPNVVFVGEMRDLESISSALTIAETGHLVFSVLHTNSASQTIDRIVDVFPDSSKDQIKVQLASVVTAIISQRLVPAIKGGRVPAFEILMITPAVRNVIREGKTFMIDNIIQTSSELGMVSLESSLAKLVKDGLVSEEVALNYVTNPLEFQNKLRRNQTL